MDVLDKATLLENLTQEYSKIVEVNQLNKETFEDSKSKYETLIANLKAFQKKLEVDALVPVGNKALFQGKLIHTNEVMVQLGESWFVQCASSSAREIAQHRIKKLNEMLASLDKEAQLYTSWEKVTREQFSEFAINSETREITEVYNEEEEKEWRIKHAENLKKYHKEQAEQRKTQKFQEEDAELWMRLNQLEIEEELQEYAEMEKEKQETLKLLNKQKSPNPPKPQENLQSSSSKSFKSEKMLTSDEINELLKNFVGELEESGKTYSKPEAVPEKSKVDQQEPLHEKIHPEVTILSSKNKKLIIEPKRRVSFSPEVDEQKRENRGNFSERMVLSFMKSLEIDEVDVVDSDESESDPLTSDSDGEWPPTGKVNGDSHKEPLRIEITHTETDEDKLKSTEDSEESPIATPSEIKTPADIWRAFRNKNEISKNEVPSKKTKSILKKKSKYGPDFPPPVFNFQEMPIEEVEENPEHVGPIKVEKKKDIKTLAETAVANERVGDEPNPKFLKDLKEKALEVKAPERKEFNFMKKNVTEKCVDVEELEKVKGDAIMEMLSQYKTITRQDNEQTKESKPMSRFKMNQM